MKLFLLLLITFATYFNIQAQEWELLTVNDDYALFIRNHSEKSAWVKWEYTKVKVIETYLGEKQKIKKSLELFKFDCDTKMSGTMAEISYDEKGNVLNSNDTGSRASMENVIPDTMGEFILFKFCESQE